MQRRELDRRGLRAARHDLRRHPARHGHRGPVAHAARRHRPPQQGDRDAPGLGDRERPHACRSQYTLPTAADGLEASGLAVLQNAVANGVRIDVVNPMVFDYYDHATTEMGGAAVGASQGLHAQLRTLYPAKTEAAIWAMQGRR